jgi:hypothetical protein
VNHDYDDIENRSDKEQLELMEQWFREHFEDPAHRTPYEGGYVWIWGGPFDAREELDQKFGEVVPEHIIEKLTETLESECVEWAPVESEDDYDQTLFEVVNANEDRLGTFRQAISTIESLLTATASSPALEPIHALLFVYVITALETYLSDTFINTVLGDKASLRKFIETNPDFQQRKVSFSEVLTHAERLPEEAKKHLLDVVWHNLGRVDAMYRATLGISFRSAMAPVARAVSLRHDIIHRSGRQKDGTSVKVGPLDVRQLIADASELVGVIEHQYNARLISHKPEPEF